MKTAFSPGPTPWFGSVWVNWQVYYGWGEPTMSCRPSLDRNASPHLKLSAVKVRLWSVGKAGDDRVVFKAGERLNRIFQALEKERFDLVLCDYRLDDTDGKEILIHIKENYPDTGVIIITAYSDIKLAVELIKLGAYDYIVKPLYPDEILNTIHKALENSGLLKSPENFVLNYDSYVDI